MMVIRIITGAFGVAVLGWSMLVLPVFQTAAPFEVQARQIVLGEAFKDRVLDQTATELDGLSVDRLVPAAQLRAAAIVRLRLLEFSLDGIGVGQLDQRVAALRGALQSSLQAAPGDPFLWLALYWLNNTQNGFAPDNLAKLAFSYELGPREGWIAFRRNRLALASFAQLDRATQDRIVAEFAGMVDVRMTSDAAGNLSEAGWPIRERLMSSLSDTDLAARRAFAKYLVGRGIVLPIPGIPDMGERPWR